MHDGLAVNANLSRRGIEVDNHCGYCGVSNENLDHVFRTCSVVKLAWEVCALQVQTETLKVLSP